MEAFGCPCAASRRSIPAMPRCRGRGAGADLRVLRDGCCARGRRHCSARRRRDRPRGPVGRAGSNLRAAATRCGSEKGMPDRSGLRLRVNRALKPCHSQQCHELVATLQNNTVLARPISANASAPCVEPRGGEHWQDPRRFDWPAVHRSCDRSGRGLSSRSRPPLRILLSYSHSRLRSTRRWRLLPRVQTVLFEALSNRRHGQKVDKRLAGVGLPSLAMNGTRKYRDVLQLRRQRANDMDALYRN